MKHPQPILVIDLFPEILERLIEMLSNLRDEEWAQPTACPGWSVRDIVAHLLGDDIGLLSRRRDAYRFDHVAAQSWQELVDTVNQLNQEWVTTTRRISPQLLVDLLNFTGSQINAYFRSLDPYSLGNPVSWAGSEPAPVWLDLAREYTERWHHQQHIRDAVGKSGLKSARYFSPVLDTFVRALPHTFRAIEAPENTWVKLVIRGDSGGIWGLLHRSGCWNLYLDPPQNADSETSLDQETAWQLFTRGLNLDQALLNTKILGDQKLGFAVLKMVSIIA